MTRNTPTNPSTSRSASTSTSRPRKPNWAEREALLVRCMAELHAEYVERINRASATGRDGEIADLAAEYDAEATRLITEHQRPTHLQAVSDSDPDEPAKRTGPLRWLTRFDPFGTSQRPAS